MGLYQLVYKSQAAEDIGYSDILFILKQAKAANSLFDVTGLLIYKDGQFLQILEGEKSTIENLTLKISQDQRHQNFKIITQSDALERIFPEFTMAYFDGDLSGKGILEVEFILDLAKKGLKSADEILQGYKDFRQCNPQLMI